MVEPPLEFIRNWREKMDNFEYQLRVLVAYTAQQLGVNAFALYQPGYLTIACFDDAGQLCVLADTKTAEDQLQVFSKLYEQIHQRMQQTSDIDIVIEY